MAHVNSGTCEKCQEIFEKFPGFHSQLRGWFIALQIDFPHIHIADAGRGKIDQETYFQRGASKAHFGQSAHNYNCAIDTFFLIDGYCLDLKLYQAIVPRIPDWLQWGNDWKTFKELPHFEVKNWKQLVAEGKLSLVESVS